jgi:hypothetical protein
MSEALGTKQSSPSQSGLGVLLRLGWMLFGFVAIAMTAMTIANRPVWTIGWRDGVFWAAVLVTALFRCLDVVKFHGETAHGERATLRDMRRYLLGLIVISVCLWSGAQSVDL